MNDFDIGYTTNTYFKNGMLIIKLSIKDRLQTNKLVELNIFRNHAPLQCRFFYMTVKHGL